MVFVIDRPSCVLLASLVLGSFASGCGDDGPADPSTDASSGTATVGASTSTITETGAADSTSAGSGSSSEAGTTAQTDSSGATTASSTDSSGDSSSGEPVETTGDPGNVVYSAIAVPGGLDRIRIAKADLDAGRCTWVVLVAPEIGGTYPGMTVPMGWSVESISINDVAAACASDNPSMFGGEAALDANGTVGFGMLGGTGIYPCTVDIDASFDFQGILPGIPPMDDMVAAGIPVTGC